MASRQIFTRSFPTARAAFQHLKVVGSPRQARTAAASELCIFDRSAASAVSSIKPTSLFRRVGRGVEQLLAIGFIGVDRGLTLGRDKPVGKTAGGLLLGFRVLDRIEQNYILAIQQSQITFDPCRPRVSW